MTQQGQPELTLLRRTGQAAHAARGGGHTLAPVTFRRKGASINQGHDEAQDLTNQLSQFAFASESWMLTHRNGNISTPHRAMQILGPVLDPGRIGTKGDGFPGRVCDQPGKIRTLVSRIPIHEVRDPFAVVSAAKVAAPKGGIKALQQSHDEDVESLAKHEARACLVKAPTVLILVS